VPRPRAAEEEAAAPARGPRGAFGIFADVLARALPLPCPLLRACATVRARVVSRGAACRLRSVESDGCTSDQGPPSIPIYLLLLGELAIAPPFNRKRDADMYRLVLYTTKYITRNERVIAEHCLLKSSTYNFSSIFKFQQTRCSICLGYPQQRIIPRAGIKVRLTQILGLVWFGMTII
jgi:hypothetical protein